MDTVGGVIVTVDGGVNDGDEELEEVGGGKGELLDEVGDEPMGAVGLTEVLFCRCGNKMRIPVEALLLTDAMPTRSVAGSDVTWSGGIDDPPG